MIKVKVTPIKIAKLHDAGPHMIPVEELAAFRVSIAEAVEEKQVASHVYDAVTQRAAAQAHALGLATQPQSI